MGGCFRPSASQQPIYAQLIDKVLAEGTKPLSTQLPSPVAQRIYKKGDLRKLVDHLSSHKYNIYSSMLYLAKLLNDQINVETVLIIANELMRNLGTFTSQQFSVPSTKSKNKMRSKKQREELAARINASNSREIEVNFEMMYFPIVMAVFDNDHNLRTRVMESVRVYAESRKEKFTQDKFVSRMLARLLIQLKSQRLVKDSIETYSALIEKSNTYLAENESNHEVLSIILEYWIHSQNDPHTRYHCSLIANIYIFECMQGREYLELFTIVLSVYDKYFFKKEVLSTIETDLLLLLSQEQVREQFLKGLFRYLLVYLSLSRDQRVRENWEKAIFTTSYIALESNHPHILATESKSNALDTLHRWVVLQFIDINELVSFNRLSLYSCFKFNILGQPDNSLLSKVLTTFTDIYLLCNQSSKFLLTQMLIEDIHYGTNIALNELQSLIWLARKFIVGGLVIADTECFNFFKPLQCVPHERLKLKEIILMYSLLLDSCKMPFNYNIIESLCDASYSFYDILDISESSVREKYQMVQSVLHFLKRLGAKGYSDLVLLWVNGIPKSKKPNSITRYFDKFLTMEVWQLLTGVRRVPDQMIHLNQQIEIRSNSEMLGEIWGYEKSHPQIKISSRLSPVQKGDVGARYLFIRDKFEKLKRKDRMPQLSEDEDRDRDRGSAKEVNRRSSVVITEHSYRTDESFQEIFGMIMSKKEAKSSYKGDGKDSLNNIN